MNRRKYLLASDYDKTLYSHRTIRIENEDRDAVKRFREAGNVFAIVTGRSLRNITDAVNDARFSDYDVIISMNGAAARLPDATFLFEHKADAAILPRLFEIIRATGGSRPAVISRFDEYYVGSPDEWDDEHPCKTPEECAALDFFSCVFSTYPSPEEAQTAVNAIKAELGDFVNPQRNGVHVDIPPAGVDKGVAVAQVASLFGVSQEDIFAVGDNMNDASMVTRYNGYAMKSGSEELAALANGTVDSVSALVDIILDKSK